MNENGDVLTRDNSNVIAVGFIRGCTPPLVIQYRCFAESDV